MKYTEDQVNNFLEDLLALRESGPVFNARVEQGVMKYQSCVPGRHAIQDTDGKIYNVTFADDTAVVGVHNSGPTKIFYAAGLSQYKILEIGAKKTVRIDNVSYEAVGELPGVGSLWTHHSGRPYLVFGYANLDAKPEKYDEYPPLILYVGQNGKVWAKTEQRFKETMARGGRFQFQENAGFEYMGILENDELVNGYITREVRQLAEQSQGLIEHVEE
uniref:Uncharacterized protein n=1 Tax=Pseudomonas phage HRDY3 TaxID=3236930 RepID=A0AB39CDV8_9VIRU